MMKTSAGVMIAAATLAVACGHDMGQGRHDGTPLPDGGGGVDGGGSDAGAARSDGGGAGGTDAGGGGSTTTEVACGTQTCLPPAKVCCITTSGRSCVAPGACAAGQEASCDGAEDCGAGAFCCQSHMTSMPVACRSSGCAGEMIACQDSSDCPSSFRSCCPAGGMMAYPYCCN